VKPFCFLPPPKHRSKTLSSNGEGSFCQFSPLVCKGYAREGFNERSSLSPIQSDTERGPARHQGFTLRGQYFFSRALQGFSKASLSLFKPSSQGPCKVCMTESNLSLLCLCDPPREGFSKASVSLFKPFSQGLCKASARDPSFCQGLCKGRLQRALLFITQSIRHGTGNQQICTPHLLI
jgi:hypothetical protein